MMVNVLVLWNWWCGQCLHAYSPVVSHLKLLNTFTTIKALKEKSTTPTRHMWVTAGGCACVCVGGGEGESEWGGDQWHCSSSSYAISGKAWSECYSGVTVASTVLFAFHSRMRNADLTRPKSGLRWRNPSTSPWCAIPPLCYWPMPVFIFNVDK